MKKLLFLFILPLLLAASCKKETQENPLNNVVRFKINGVAWESQCDGNIVFGCEAVNCWFKRDSIGLITIDLNATNKYIDNFKMSFRKLIVDNYSFYKESKFFRKIILILNTDS